jgi:hypothetical protein
MKRDALPPISPSCRSCCGPAAGTKLTPFRLVTSRAGRMQLRSGGNYASPCNPNPCGYCGDLVQRARCCIGTGHNFNHTGLPYLGGTFNPRHFNCHQLHDVVQFAGRELSSGLFRSSAARSPQCRRFRFQRTLSNPNTKRDGEPGLHDRLHFGATCVSDELRPTSLHSGTIAGRASKRCSDYFFRSVS